MDPALRLMAVAACALLCACATPGVTPPPEPIAPRLASAAGPLTLEQSAAVLRGLEARAPDSGIFERHVAVEEAIAASPLSVGNRVTLLKDGPDAFREMQAAIVRARRHVHLETYAIEDDEVGRGFARDLIEAKRRGAQVNLLYDAVGSIATPPDFFAQLRKAGVDVLAFNPVIPPSGDPNRRNHRKLLVVDGRVAFVGGINVSAVFASGPPSVHPEPPAARSPWRDTSVRLEGPVVAEMQKTFIESWSRAAGAPPRLREAFPALRPAGNDVVRTLASWGGDDSSPVHAALISAIDSAEKSVHITMAYFVPAPPLLEALENAARRGVDVHLVLPGFSDFWVVFHAGRSHYTSLLRSGVKIHEHREQLLHAKTAVIDGVWSTVGSANLDWRSFVHNHELNAVILGAQFGAQMEAMFAADVARSQPVGRQAWSERSLADRVREAAARVWEYWL